MEIPPEEDASGGFAASWMGSLRVYDVVHGCVVRCLDAKNAQAGSMVFGYIQASVHSAFQYLIPQLVPTMTQRLQDSFTKACLEARAEACSMSSGERVRLELCESSVVSKSSSNGASASSVSKDMVPASNDESKITPACSKLVETQGAHISKTTLAQAQRMATEATAARERAQEVLREAQESLRKARLA